MSKEGWAMKAALGTTCRDSLERSNIDLDQYRDYRITNFWIPSESWTSSSYHDTITMEAMVYGENVEELGKGLPKAISRKKEIVVAAEEIYGSFYTRMEFKLLEV